MSATALLAADDDCPLWYDFDFSTAAEMYAQLAATLAGFAFVAITLVLNRQHRREALGHLDPVDELVQDRRCIAGMACGFLGLIATTTMYAAVSGEQDCALTHGRASSAEMLAGVAFAFSLFTLLFAVVQLVSAAALGQHIRFIVAVITPPVIVAYIMTALDDLALSMASPPEVISPSGPIEPLWTQEGKALWDAAQTLTPWLSAAVFAVCAGVWWFGRRIRQDAGQPGRFVEVLLMLLPYISLLLIFAALGRSLLLSPLDPGDRISPAEGWLLVAVSTVVVLAQSVCLSLERGDEHVDIRPATR